MRILGVDPGLNVTGYGVIEDTTFRVVEAGVIRTMVNTPIQERLAKIYGSITDIIAEHKPGVLVLEKIYSHYKHPTTAILMGHARGVTCLACGINDVRLVNYPSTRIKKAVSGNGHASKVQVQRVVQRLLGLKTAPEPVNVTDALAMAISFCLIEQNRAVFRPAKTGE